MKFFFLGKLLAYLGRKTDGYKTKAGGLGLILTGLVGLLGHLYPDQGLPTMELENVVTTVSAGFVALGLGGKAEKLKAALEVKPNAPAPPEIAEQNVGN